MVIVTRELVDEWRKWYLTTGHSLSSTSTYYSFIKKYVREEVDITQETVDKFRSNNMSCPASGSLKSFFKYIIDKKKFPKSILEIRFDRNKHTRKYPESITVREVEIIINNIEQRRSKILTMILFELGLRINEGLKMNWNDFNWSDWLLDQTQYGKVVLRQTKRDKFRTMPVPSRIMKILYEACSNKTESGIPITGFVFRFGVGIEEYLKDRQFTSEENLYRYLDYEKNYYRDILARVSMECIGKKVNPHMLRHSKAQFLMDRGMSIESLKRFLGHKSISTTEIYAQASTEKLMGELVKFDNYEKN